MGRAAEMTPRTHMMSMTVGHSLRDMLAWDNDAVELQGRLTLGIPRVFVSWRQGTVSTCNYTLNTNIGNYVEFKGERTS